ncbi:MAG: TnsA-like heteromeric transposase endonuclease subunit [Actinomycetia bacterium]|nr:TnsA-like heteromeric transposase endonuclease subunit [Actinomycetes bacterium]
MQTAEWNEANHVASRPLAPVRTFRWRYGQRHYSGTYWSATLSDHVIYESRLELARLLYADFDRDVTSIVAQPFLMQTDVDSKRRCHIPDFLLHTATGPVVVDVKPLLRTTVAKVAYTFAWARQLVEELGWSYEVWTEPPAVELANLRFLAGYRDPGRVNREFVEELESKHLHGLSIGQAINDCAGWPEPIARAGLYHLLWRGTVKTDLQVTLQPTSILHQGAHQ